MTEPMTPQPESSWQPPEPTVGPAPGVEFADPGPRLIGYIIDVVITGGIAVALAIVAAILAAILPILAIVPILAIFIVTLVYFPYFWARSGQTPGMMLMNIKVVRDSDGGPITTGAAILRLIGYWISGLVFYIGYIWIFIDKRRRGWFDLIAGTVVVKAEE